MSKNIQDSKLVINVLGNSQATPNLRNKLPLQETYAYNIHCGLNIDNIVINNANRNNTVLHQAVPINLEDEVLSLNADYHILQFGIVDCAPRLFTERERWILSFVPGKKFIIRFMSKHRYFFTRIFPKVYVKKKAFREKYLYLIQTILEQTKTKKIFIINIPDTRERNRKRSYRIEDNIKDYNSIIREIAEKYPEKVIPIDLYEMTRADTNLVSEDGIHLFKEAHDLLAQLICDKIREHEKNSS